MRQFKDISNQTFNYLTAIKHLGNSTWLCKCVCGREKGVNRYDLERGYTKSCGCKRPSLISQVRSKGKKYNKRLNKSYNCMKERCLNPNNPAYKHYGGRGIKVCDEWLISYDNFYWWALEKGYKDNLTIDRIDVNGNYEPGNCRWVSMDVQRLNKRDTIRVEIEGVSFTIPELSKKYNIDRRTIYTRYYRGYRGKELISLPGTLKHNQKGKLKTLC